MGLDGVELVMDVEDHFGITITDAEATSMRTVGDLVELCRRRILAIDTTRCMSLPCFLALRRTTREVMSDPALRLRPSSTIADTLPPSKRRELWRQLPGLLETTPPSLRRPRPLRIALLSSVLIAVFVCLIPLFVNIAILPLSLCGAAAAAICLHLATVRFRSEPPVGFATFGDVTRHMVGIHVATKPPASAEAAAVLDELRPIIAGALGIHKDEVVPTARFVEDLGVG